MVLHAADSVYRDFTIQIDPRLSVYRAESGKGYTLQAILTDTDGTSLAQLSCSAEEVLDLEHKASRMNEWFPQRGPRKMGRMTTDYKESETMDCRDSVSLFSSSLLAGQHRTYCRANMPARRLSQCRSTGWADAGKWPADSFPWSQPP